MVTSRDDFSIAVRAAFLKKGVKQKFSILALIIASIILLSLESINSKSLNFVRSAIKDVIYRTSFIASVPGNSIVPSFTKIQNYSYVPRNCAPPCKTPHGLLKDDSGIGSGGGIMNFFLVLNVMKIIA